MNIMNELQSIAVRTVLGVTLALALAGCASMPASPDATATHPANAHAESSPVPPWRPGLLTITNMVVVKPLTEPAPHHQHGHEQPEAKPKTEEEK